MWIEEPKRETNTTIILRENDKWTSISAELKNHTVNDNKARMATSGLQIELSSEDDCRTIRKIFKNQNIQLHTLQLPSENKLKIIYVEFLIRSHRRKSKMIYKTNRRSMS